MNLNILVTGTSSGFGRLIALSLARNGHNVFATMRDIDGRCRKDADGLRGIAREEGLKISIVEMSLTSEESVNNAVKRVIDQAGQIDVVVNNAGVSVVGLEETITPEQLLAHYDVNLVGPHRVARAVLPSMRARGQGLLIQISSELSQLVIPFMGAYGGSKAALESLFEAYSYELKPLGVEVALVQPGAYPTEFTSKGAFGSDMQRAKTYGPMENGPQQLFEGLGGMMTGPNAPNPQDVADAVVKLVAMPAGSRPLRTVVDKMMGGMIEGVNNAHSQLQRGALTGMGLGGLL